MTLEIMLSDALVDAPLPQTIIKTEKFPLVNMQLVERMDGPDIRYYLQKLVPEATDYECPQDAFVDIRHEANRRLRMLETAIVSAEQRYKPAPFLSVLHSVSILMRLQANIPRIGGLLLTEVVLDQIRKDSSMSEFVTETMKHLSVVENYTPPTQVKEIDLAAALESTRSEVNRISDHLMKTKNKVHAFIMRAEEYRDEHWFLLVLYTLLLIAIAIAGFVAAAKNPF